MTGARRPSAVLFDLDGTLVDTVGTRAHAWMEVFDARGIGYDEAHIRGLVGADGIRLAREVAHAAGRSIDDAEALEIDHRAGAAFSRLNAHPQALPGVVEILADLDARAIPWAIATSSRPDQVQASIDALGLTRAPRVTDGSHVRHAKPAPDLLLAAADQAGMAPATTWYVGDSRWDMLAAVAAGMVALGVATGATSEAALRESGAQRTFADLVALRADLP